jgi:hypothetical protein
MIYIIKAQRYEHDLLGCSSGQGGNTLIIKITELALLCSFEIKKNISFEKFIEWLTYRFLLPLMFGFCRISHLFSFCNVQMKKVR